MKRVVWLTLLLLALGVCVWLFGMSSGNAGRSTSNRARGEVAKTQDALQGNGAPTLEGIVAKRAGVDADRQDPRDDAASKIVYRVSGAVRDPDGNPVAGVAVGDTQIRFGEEVIPDGDTYETKSRDDGRFDLVVTLGEYTLPPKAPLRVELYAELEHWKGETKSVRLMSSSDGVPCVKNIDFVVSPPALLVTGVVASDESQPLATNTRVEVWMQRVRSGDASDESMRWNKLKDTELMEPVDSPSRRSFEVALPGQGSYLFLVLVDGKPWVGRDVVCYDAAEGRFDVGVLRVPSLLRIPVRCWLGTRMFNSRIDARPTDTERKVDLPGHGQMYVRANGTWIAAEFQKTVDSQIEDSQYLPLWFTNDLFLSDEAPYEIAIPIELIHPALELRKIVSAPLPSIIDWHLLAAELRIVVAHELVKFGGPRVEFMHKGEWISPSDGYGHDSWLIPASQRIRARVVWSDSKTEERVIDAPSVGGFVVWNLAAPRRTGSIHLRVTTPDGPDELRIWYRLLAHSQSGSSSGLQARAKHVLSNPLLVQSVLFQGENVVNVSSPSLSIEIEGLVVRDYELVLTKCSSSRVKLGHWYLIAPAPVKVEVRDDISVDVEARFTLGGRAFMSLQLPDVAPVPNVSLRVRLNNGGGDVFRTLGQQYNAALNRNETEVLPPGTYELEVASPGYNTSIVEVEIEKRKTAVVNVPLVPLEAKAK